MSIGFVKNQEFLEENHKTNDLLDFSEIQENLKRMLDNIPHSATLGVVGAFGTGKSTMLHQLTTLKRDTEKWIHFDAWKFPERNNLWEGFVLDFVREMDPAMFEDIRRKVDGKDKEDIRSLIKVVFRGANHFLPGLGIGENFASLFHSSPVRRVFEFQELLEDFINTKTGELQKIYVVIEDIDRSGDNGIFFLETFKQFIKSSNLQKKVVAIVPISAENYSKNKDSYLKCIDYTFRFEPKSIRFNNLIDKVIDDTFFDENTNWKDHLNQVFQDLVSANSLTIREFKSILRNIDLKYRTLSPEQQDKIDIRVLIILLGVNALGKNITANINDGMQIFSTEQAWVKSDLILIGNNLLNLKGYVLDVPMIFVNNPQLKIPKMLNNVGNPRDNGYYLSDYYLNLF